MYFLNPAAPRPFFYLLPACVALSCLVVVKRRKRAKKRRRREDAKKGSGGGKRGQEEGSRRGAADECEARLRTDDEGGGQWEL